MVKIFENWTFMRPLPAPFADEIAKRGKKDTSEEACLSVHNHMTRGKRATLHAPTLRALLALSDIINGTQPGAMGFKMSGSNVEWYCGEYVKTTGAVTEIRLVVYDPQTGGCRGIVRSGTVLSAFPQLSDRGGTGKEILMLLAFASIVNGPLHDSEFYSAFSTLCDEKQKGFLNPALATELAFLCCDNLYRRIANGDALGADGIPFDSDAIASGNVPIIATSRLDDGYYNPTRTHYGVFQILKTVGKGVVGTIGEIAGKYNGKFELTEEEQQLVPRLPDDYDVPEEVMEILEAVMQTPMRVFMSAGEAGTGKTTNAKMIAQLLGLPYYFFTCGEGTDEIDLVSSMIPNIGKKSAVETGDMPSYQDMLMDPASAFERVSGVYEEEMEPDEAFRRILSAVYQKGYQGGQGEKDYVMVESSIVTGCRRPSVIEIQEPSVITKPGTLVKLNGLLDDGAAITLTNGELVRRNPETVILLTTNMGYKGCRGFNESVLSRMRMIHYLEPMNAEDMVERIQKKGYFTDLTTLRKMADTVCEVQKYCREAMIAGGVCGYREYEDWVWAYSVQHDICKAAKRTIVAKAAPEEEDRKDIYKTKILTRFAENQAA